MTTADNVKSAESVLLTLCKVLKERKSVACFDACCVDTLVALGGKIESTLKWYEGRCYVTDTARLDLDGVRFCATRYDRPPTPQELEAAFADQRARLSEQGHG